MKFSYQRDMTHNYMIPEPAEAPAGEDYRVHMLLENRIRGLLPCDIRKHNGEIRFYYDITSRQSMEQICGKWLMSAQELRSFLQGLSRALKEMEKYLLDMDMLVLEPQAIFMDVETREPCFCCLPGYKKDIAQSFREITDYILEHIDQGEDAAVLLAYEVYRRAREERYSLEEILRQEVEREMPRIEERGEQSREDMGYLWERRAKERRTPEEYRTDSRERDSFRGEAWDPGDHRETRRSRETRENPETWRAEELEDQPETKEIRGSRRKLNRKKARRPEKPKPEEYLTEYQLEEPEEGPAKQTKGSRGKKEDKKQKGEKKAKTILCLCFFFAILLAGAAAWLWGLDTTQIGGIVFLLTGLLLYGLSADARQKKKKTKKKEEDVYEEWKEQGYEEEECGEEDGPERAPKHMDPPETEYGRRPGRRAVYADRVADNKPAYGKPPVYAPRYAARDIPRERRVTREPQNRQERERRMLLGDTGVLREEELGRPSLVLVSADPRRRDAVILERDSYIVGKLSSEADILLEDPSVSRIHARIERRGEEYDLCDLNSTNGTFLNGRRLNINESVPIHPSDEIYFARVGYRVGKC